MRDRWMERKISEQPKDEKDRGLYWATIARVQAEKAVTLNTIAIVLGAVGFGMSILNIILILTGWLTP